jgi:hypothetical protein
MIVRDNEDSQVRYMFQIKNNLAKEGPPVSFRFGKTGFRWLGKCNKKLEDVLTGSPESRSKRDKAAEKIRSLLKESAMPSNEVYAALGQIGIAKKTVRIAKEDIGAVAFRKNKTWYWSLEKQ